jgi:hypothetical protein
MNSRYAWALGVGPIPLCLLAGICLLSTGCTPGDFDFGKVQNMVQINPVSLDGEQVMLTEGMVQCGVQNDLWTITQLDRTKQVGKLTQAARDLHFGDDVVIGDPAMHTPYVQVRGNLQLRLIDVGSVRDDGDKHKLVDLKVGVEIPHDCFKDPLPQLMAVRHGQFTQDALPTFRFRMEDSWVLDRVQH